MSGRPWDRTRAAALLGTGAYWLAIGGFGKIGVEHLVVGGLVIGLASGGPKLAKWRTLFLPLLLTTMVYDSQRLYSDAIRGAIHVSEPYDFDLRWFGIRTSAGVMTPNEWWQLHLHPALDLASGFAYLFFIPAFFLVAGYFLFALGAREARLASQLTWGFFWLNVLGYSTYYWYPAAPPWYVAEHGFGPANLAVPASLAGCARFDELLGIPIFKTWYGKSADVFGAVPSLHVAYPFLAAIYALRVGRLRVATGLFYLWVSFAAVYLNHHYILDVLWGSGYALLVAVITWRLAPREAPLRSSPLR